MKRFLAVALGLVGLGVSVAAPPDEAQLDKGHIRKADFPQVAQRVEAFEERINSPRVADRESVLYQFGHAAVRADAETVRFLKRIMKHDPDAWVRGLAVKALHDLWVPLDPGELPASFGGYHRGVLIDRQREGQTADLIAQVKAGDLAGGYAAYAVGLLRLKEAVPDLRNLAEAKNVFVRYSAARALLECGDRASAGAILKTIMNHPIPAKAAFADVEDPYYQALAARAYMEVGPAEKKAGTERLIELLQELEAWQDINAQGRLENARRVLATVSGRYFVSHKDARAWFEQQKP